MKTRRAVTTLGLIALMMTANASRPLGEGGGGVVPGATNGVERFHYSITGRVRPLLFWISRAGVGDAVITRWKAPGEVGYSLLIGSDPDRAPWSLNRWGYIEEENRGGVTRLIGLMVESDEESVAEAEASVRKASVNGHTFKVMQATVEQERACSVIRSIVSAEDYNMRQAGVVLDLARREQSIDEARELKLPRGTRPGFLTAVAELMRAEVEHRRAGRHSESNPPLSFVYHGRIHQLRQAHVKAISSLSIGNVSYGPAVKGDFIVTGPGDSAQQFSVTYGTDGRFAEVPLAISYQPHWWLQIDLTIEVGAGSP
jgi:hypothetical protein